MTPSERVTAIKEICDRLAPEKWPIIDLTLKNFNFPTTDEWSENEDTYILAMIENGSDENIIALSEHLGYEINSKRSSLEPSYWESDYLRLFISHISLYKDYASSLQEELLNYGVSGFVAHKDIKPAKEWQDEIIIALQTADALVALLNEGFHNSDWTDQEIGFAMGKSLLVVSISLGETPYGFIGRHQALSGLGKKPGMLAYELSEIFKSHKETQKRMALATLRIFENSFSFRDAKEKIKALENLTYWDKTLAMRLEKAVKENNQISGSFGVPERVKALLKKWV